jgi:hypothetical protein
MKILWLYRNNTVKRNQSTPTTVIAGCKRDKRASIGHANDAC